MVNKLKKNSSMTNDQPPKPKKIRTAPTNTSLLPPCKVCQEPAAGFHYGVNTCEACKGFFRRTLVREGDYDCVNGDERCTIVQTRDGSKKRMCPRCRHLKCLAVGMSPDAIKTGRYTHAKRTQDILEYRQVMGCLDDSSCASPFSPDNTTLPSNSPSNMSVLSSASTLESTSDLQYRPTSAGGNDTNPSPLSVLQLDHAQEHVLSPAKFNAACVQCTALTDSGGLVGPASVSSCDTGTLVSGDVLSPFSSPELPSPLSGSAFVDSILDHVVRGEPEHCGESSGKDSSSSSDCLPDGSTLTTLTGETNGDMTEEECRELSLHLLQSYRRVFLNRYEFSAEEMLRKQQECYENCKARIEAFGPMGGLSEEEYLEVYQSTGIDVDDRQTFITVLSKMLDKHIRQYIGFVKTIPGFSELSINDQIRLIKDNRCEVGLISQSTGYNHELKVITMPSGNSFCEHDMEKLGGRERMDVRCSCLHSIQKLGLSEDEKVIFKCFVLFTVGNEDMDEYKKVCSIQWKMAQCLLWLLKENGKPNPTKLFTQIIDVTLKMRNSCSDFYEWIKSKPFAHYAQFKNNDLLAEWFSNG